MRLLLAAAVFLCATAALGVHAASVQAKDEGALTATELAVAKATRPSVVRVRWRDGRFGDVRSTRNAIVVRRDGLLVMAGLPPSRRGTFTARLSDGRELRAQIVGSDTETALTVLRLPTTGLVPVKGAAAPPPPEGTKAPVPDLAPPALGTRVVMVTGDGAVAAGPVRAHGRHGRFVDPVARSRKRTTALVGIALAAVDADAGAPLLDARGRLQGLVAGRKDTLEAATGRVPPGLVTRPTPVEVVAVPAAVVRMAWPLIARHGRLPRAGLGVETAQAEEALRQHLGLETGGHVLQRLTPEGRAARAGLRRHDVIVAIDGRAFDPGTTLHDVLLPYRPGAQVELGLIRGGQRLTVPVTLGERAAR